MHDHGLEAPHFRIDIEIQYPVHQAPPAPRRAPSGPSGGGIIAGAPRTGNRPQGRDLPLIVVDAHGDFTPEAVRIKGGPRLHVESFRAIEAAQASRELELARIDALIVRAEASTPGQTAPGQGDDGHNPR